MLINILYTFISFQTAQFVQCESVHVLPPSPSPAVYTLQYNFQIKGGALWVGIKLHRFEKRQLTETLNDPFKMQLLQKKYKSFIYLVCFAMISNSDYNTEAALKTQELSSPKLCAPAAAAVTPVVLSARSSPLASTRKP